jgi:hypothetical protein
MIGDFDTGVNNFIDESGCTLADGISEALGWPIERVHVIDTDLGQSVA